MTGAATRHQAAVLRLTQDAIALARQLPGTPSRIRLRDGSCEIEIEWDANGQSRAGSEPAVDESSEAPSGRHRRATDAPPVNAPFLRLAAGRH